MKASLLFVGLAWVLSACVLVSKEDLRVLYVAPETVECVGVGPQRCLLVRESPEAEWGYFYDSILGFEHQEGTAYTLEVAVETVVNPPADASSLRYRLVRILDSQKVTDP